MDSDRYDPVPHTQGDTARWLADPKFKAAYDALEEEYAALTASSSRPPRKDAV
ncbi:MAG: hypothetical protein HQL87_11745 [Magnetococcales bacterium]|nr:hypothetical protein [Magnetococcales bacterium]